MNYSTNFSLTESPISEGAKWTTGGVTGIDWHDPKTTGGKVLGTQPGTDPGKFTDSIGTVNGVWGADQTVTVTAFANVVGGLYFTEVEILLRFTIGAHSCTGYEFTMNVNPSQSYMQVNRWTGGAFNNAASYVQLVSVAGIVANGDVLVGSAIGNVLTLKQNGVQVFQITDNTLTSGNPGVGMFNEDNGGHIDSANWGFTNFTATDGNNPILAHSRVSGRGIR